MTLSPLYLRVTYSKAVFLAPGWNELLIAGFSHRSVCVPEGILLATGLHVHRATAHEAGVGTIFDRVLTELVAKMREMKMDKTEMGCLRAIVLFNPGECVSEAAGCVSSIASPRPCVVEKLAMPLLHMTLHCILSKFCFNMHFLFRIFNRI